MRKGAGTGYGVLHTLKSGTTCTVLDGPIAATGYQWYRLDCGSSRIGWVAGSYLKLVSSSSPTPVKTPTKTPTTTPLESSTKMIGAFADGQPVRTTTGNVKLRKGAGTGYGIVLTLQAGSVCYAVDGPVAASGFQWYELYCLDEDKTGWAAGSYLTPLSVPSDVLTYTLTGNLKMRSGPGLNYTVLHTLSLSTSCSVLENPVYGDGYQWYRLDCGSSRIGWVAGAYLGLDMGS